MCHKLSMYFQGVWCIYGWESTGSSKAYHFIVWIALYLVTSFILVWLCVFIGGWKIIDIWLPLFWLNLTDKCNIDLCNYIIVFSYIKSNHYFFIVGQIDILGPPGFLLKLLLLHSLWCRFDSKYEHISWYDLRPILEYVWVVLSCLAVMWPTTPSIFPLFYYIGF